MARLSLEFLGHFAVHVDGQPLTDFPYDKVRALLAYLAVEGDQPHRREHLGALLWPDAGSRQARRSLSQALYALRRLLADAGPNPLLVDRHEVCFDRACDCFCDVTAFRTGTACAGDPPTTELLARCEEAMALYQGPFLRGFSLPDAEPFNEWSLLQREWLQRMALETLRRLSKGWDALGDPARALDSAWRLVDLEPWDEESHRQVITLLLRAGRHEEALAQYDRCRTILLRELGVAPRSETSALVEGVQHASVVRADAARPPPAAHTPHLLLPATPFIGRADELARIARRLADPACRLLTIVGPGGVGKTRLAIQAAQAQSNSFAHGVRLVDLAAVGARESLPGALLHALRIPRTGAGDADAQLLAYLRPRGLLLLLDNCEHLPGCPAFLVRLLYGAPALKLLVTSRVRLNLHDEWLLPLQGLDVPTAPSAGALHPDASAGLPATDPSHDLNAFGATRLFLSTARRLAPGVQPTAEDAAQIARICRLLDGNPLAIELAAAWVRTLPCGEIADRLAADLSLLTTGLRDVPARHRSMTAAFDHSWALLTQEQRRQLARLAIFQGGFHADAAQAVAGASLEHLAALVDGSWIWAGTAGRYRMHELTRQYCMTKCPDLAEGTAGGKGLRDDHCAYFSSFLHGREQGYNWRRRAMADIAADTGNILAAWRWAVETSNRTRVEELSMSLFFLAEMEGLYHTILDLFEVAVQQLRTERAEPATVPALRNSPVVLRVWLLHHQANLYLALGLLHRARDVMEEARAMVEAGAESAALAECRIWLKLLSAWLLEREGDDVAANAQLHELAADLQVSDVPCWPYVPEVGTRFMQAHVDALLGETAWRQGDYQGAEAMVRTALALRDEIGERRFRAFNLSLLARILETRGSYAQATRTAQQGLRLSQEFGDRIGAAEARLALARLETVQGAADAARQQALQVLEVARQTGNHDLLMGALTCLADQALAQGDVDGAADHLQAACHALADLGETHSNHRVAVALGLGRVALARQDFMAAERHFQHALHAPGHAAWEVMEARAGLGRLLLQTGEPARSVDMLTGVAANPATAERMRVQAQAWLAQAGQASSSA